MFDMQSYKRINNIVGWLVFIFATAVYGLTMEKSGSFWDCGEFVSSAFKLQVAHPPGAPFFLLVGRIFSLFAGGDVTKVATMVNFLSAVSTSASVLFCYWSVTMLVGKIAFKDKQYTTGQQIMVVGSGLIAALSCTFLDSLWFSAVEGEVYALSQFFWSFIVWAILKWDESEDKYADRWLLLIAYMTGLSIGVHLLSLLTLPFVALIYYFKKKKGKPNFGGIIIAGLVGFVIPGLYMKFIISFTQSYFAGLDLLFVNTLSLPFNSGVIFGVVLLVALLVTLVRYTHTGSSRDFYIALGISVLYALVGFAIWDSLPAVLLRLSLPVILFFVNRSGYNARRYFNLGLLALCFSYIGYISYLMVPIRGIANPPINMNRPIDPYSLKSYVDREQYGDRPLVVGPPYTIDGYDILGTKSLGPRYSKDVASGTYKYVGDKIDYEIKEDAMMLFPRLGFWQEEGKKQAYRAILQPNVNVVDAASKNVIKTFPNSQREQADAFVAQQNQQGNQYKAVDDISFGDNIWFFLKYQVGYMYGRYLMWNFAGRQNDIQGTCFNDDGGWICGIPFIDNNLKIWGHPQWPQEGLPKVLEDNKAQNKFYLIPLILALIGIGFTYVKDEKVFWSILALFIVSGLFQIVYQNEPPIEPRERDYAQAGSFVAFCFWLGFGVYAIADLLRKKIGEVPAGVVAVGVSLSAPILMGSQGWDDHNRDGRTTARDFAVDYLESCEPNAILFTQGDNDTYPLWYAQEVEGVRTDIRIINLSLLGVDWYIDQLRYKTNNAAPIKITFTSAQVAASNRDVVRYSAAAGISPSTPQDLGNVMKFIASDDPRAKTSTNQNGGDLENYLPTKTFYVNVDPAKAAAMNMLEPGDTGLLPRIEWTIGNGTLLKNDLLTLDILANNINERPIYFAVSVAPEAYLGLEKFFQLEGLTYRIVAKANPSGSAYNAPVNTALMYRNMVSKFRFGGIESNPNIYLDENIMRMTVNIRGNYGRLAEALIDKGESQKAIAALDHSMKMLPVERVPLNVFAYQYPDMYYRAGAKEQGRKVLEGLVAQSKDNLRYFRIVYNYLLKQAIDNGDMEYAAQLKAGAFTENRTVREPLYILQEMSRVAAKYESPEFAKKISDDFDTYKVAFMQQQQGQ
jgi:hypothetical protein